MDGKLHTEHSQAPDSSFDSNSVLRVGYEAASPLEVPWAI